MDFGIGYRWRSYESNLLLSVRVPPRRQGASAAIAARSENAEGDTGASANGRVRRGTLASSRPVSGGSRARCRPRCGEPVFPVDKREAFPA